MMRSRFKYDYYTVTIPSDMYPDDPERAADYAIDVAKGSTRIYALPALWTAECIGNNGFEAYYKVRRRRTVYNRPFGPRPDRWAIP
jgi:hypothetical protein